MNTTKVQFVVGDASTNISLGDVRDAIVVEANVLHVALVPQFLTWCNHVPKDIRLQVWASIADKELFRQELARMLKE